MSRSTIHCSPRSSTPTAGQRSPGRISPAALGQNRRITNNLILDGSANYFDGAYGVKTGTTDRAGSNLVSAAERLVCECDTDSDGYTHRDVIAVVVGSADNGTSAGDRFSDSRALLEFGLSSG